MKSRPYYVPRGLSTTGYSGGSPDEFDTFQNVETDHGGFEARGGMVRLAKIADARGILDFDGTDDKVTLPTDFSTLGLIWTIGVLFQTDSIASDRFLVGRPSATTIGFTLKHTTTSTVVVTLIDSGATTITLTFTGISAGTLCSLIIWRNGATVTGWLNGTTASASGSIGAALLLKSGFPVVGADNGGSFFDGGIDRMTCWSAIRTTKQDAYRRIQNPWHKDLVFNYVFTQGTASTPDVHDVSKFGLHAAVSGTPSWARTPLSNSAPIQGMAYSTRIDGTRELAIMSAGRPYTAAVT